MKYTVEVTGPVGSEPRVDDFEETDSEKYDEREAEARAAFASAVQEFDVNHTVTLYRDLVSLGNAKGTGSGTLPDVEPEEEEEPARTRMVEGPGSLLVAQADEKRAEENTDVVDGSPRSEDAV